MAGHSKQGLVVQPRDTRLFTELGVLRVADREHVECVAGFGSVRRANDRLLRLTQAGLLRRFFIGTRAGGRRAVYTLSPRGAKLVGAPPGLARARDELLIANFFVDHQLRINEIYCAAKFRPIPSPETQFLRWVFFTESVVSSFALIPDGWFELRVKTALSSNFVEVDLGTEKRSVWQGKVKAYLRYAVTGAFAQQFGDRPFRVLAIANSRQRAESLRRATAAVTDKIFWFTSFDAIEHEGLWSAVWRRPNDDRQQGLLPNP